jgi:hypothetical protein
MQDLVTRPSCKPGGASLEVHATTEVSFLLNNNNYVYFAQTSMCMQFGTWISVADAGFGFRFLETTPIFA